MEVPNLALLLKRLRLKTPPLAAIVIAKCHWKPDFVGTWDPESPLKGESE